ncbi:MAG: response regulator transcription factor [Bacteroidota bacterium]|nr:response regulator transcription factor [Bacteroidota bacterium]
MIKVIVYDSSDERRKGLTSLLSLSPNILCVGSFDTCQEAIGQVGFLMPDILLLDIDAPLATCIEGIQKIKQLNPTIKIIVETSLEEDSRIFDTLSIGIEGLILKNASAEKIIQNIEDVFNGGGVMSPTVALKVMNYFNSKKNQANAEYGLTNREKEVLKHLADGLSYKMIAGELHISYFTVNAHIKKIYEKLQVHSLGEALALTINKNIV